MVAKLPLLLGLVLAVTKVGASSPFDTLLLSHPAGLLWNAEVWDNSHKSLGTLHLRITADTAKSCLGAIGVGLKVTLVKKDALSDQLFREESGVAGFDGKTLRIDLGSPCDAYQILEGTVAPDGSSIGEVISFGISGGTAIGTYHATVQ